MPLADVASIQDGCKDMDFRWVLPESEVHEYVGKQDEAMEPPPEETQNASI